MSNCVKVFVRSRKKEFHPDKTPKALNPMSYAVRKHLSVNVLASAIALLSSVASPMAYALGLGQMNVQSALGEPLKAEIDILELTAGEAASLKAGIAPAAAFKVAGLEYSAAVVNMQVTLLKRADGRPFLKLTSTRPMTEPFVDVLLEAAWSSGRIMRDYTLLFDPPNLRQAATPNPAAIERPISAPVAPPTAPPIESTAGMKGLPGNSAGMTTSTPAKPFPFVKKETVKVTPARNVLGAGQQINVSKGDTAGGIAAKNKPESVSLDQMLVALLRNNPDAFTGGNINRLKSGSVLEIPSESDANTTSVGDASKTIIAQAQDFNVYRRKLASAAPLSQSSNANRQAEGKVESRIEERTPSATAPDKLTLSKGTTPGKTLAEDKIANDRQSKDAAARAAELAKNIDDLNKLAIAPSSQTSPSRAPASAANGLNGQGIAVAKPGGIGTSPLTPGLPTTAASSPQSAANVSSTTNPGINGPAVTTPVAPSTQAASAPDNVSTAITAPIAPQAQEPASAPASAPAPIATTQKQVSSPPSATESGMLESLKENALLIGAFSSLLLLLAGMGLYRHQRRKSLAQIDSSFLESRLQPDSFFGASGGQHIDTSEDRGTGSSLIYSPSQLDAADDVDPVAEADVYLAYGRELQAEEILKEAMRTTPRRVAIHAKLLEIYAKRRDVKAFEVVAKDALNLTLGEGHEWAHIRTMGAELDQANPMYELGERPPAVNRASPENDKPADLPVFSSSTISPIIEPQYQPPLASVDFDLDLSFFTADQPPQATIPASPVLPTVAAAAARSEPSPAINTPLTPSSESVLDNKVSEQPAVSTPLQASTATKPLPALYATASHDSGMLEFDLGSLSLDLDASAVESPTTSLMPVDDPLEIKLALAQEFSAVGDHDGARSLADEVVAQAEGPLKLRAQAFVRELA